MKRRSVNLIAETNSKGQLLVDSSKMNEFTKLWANRKFNISIELYPETTSKAVIVYYYKSVVPEFQHAYKEKQGENLTLEQVDIELRKMSSIMHDEVVTEDGFRLRCHVSIQKAGTQRAIEFIDDIKIIGAKQFGVAIQDG